MILSLFFFFFQISSSIRTPLRAISAFLAMYSEYYYSDANTLFKMLRLPYAYLKYFLCPELLSRRIVDINENSQCYFGKSIMNLLETNIFKIFQEITEHRISVNKLFQIPPKPLQVFSRKHETHIEIPVPSLHIGTRQLTCRLLSSRWRKGMVRRNTFFLCCKI